MPWTRPHTPEMLSFKKAENNKAPPLLPPLPISEEHNVDDKASTDEQIPEKDIIDDDISTKKAASRAPLNLSFYVLPTASLDTTKPQDLQKPEVSDDLSEYDYSSELADTAQPGLGDAALGRSPTRETELLAPTDPPRSRQDREVEEPELRGKELKDKVSDTPVQGSYSGI